MIYYWEDEKHTQFEFTAKIIATKHQKYTQ